LEVAQGSIFRKHASKPAPQAGCSTSGVAVGAENFPPLAIRIHYDIAGGPFQQPVKFYLDDMKSEYKNCSIHDACERIVPSWIVFLDNVPTAIMFLLGTILVGFVWWPLAILMLIYNLSSIVMFWALICPCCPHFGMRACPCGYGVVAARYFSSKEGRNFRKVFRKNIAIMFPCWFIPLGAGIYLLYARFSMNLLMIFVAFVVIGFVLIPAISRFVGCKGCELKEQCPWMSSAAAGVSSQR
jgi:hypothetical protein